MIETKRQEAKTEIQNAIKGSIGDARQAINDLISAFQESVRLLGVEQNNYVFNNFVQNIRDLQCVMEYISELNRGLNLLESTDLRTDPVSAKNYAMDILQEINGAFTSCDWVLLADLIEYELIPLLSEEVLWLEEIGMSLRS